MLRVDDIRLVSVEGSPRERGQIHGEALRPAILFGMERWKDSLHRATGLHPDDYLDRFVEATNFLPAIERWAPRLLDEARGIGEGAGIAFRDIYAYQLMDEEWLFRRDQLRLLGTPEHCSVVGVFGEDGPPLLAQNMDLPKYYDGAQTLLRVAHQDGTPDSLIFTAAGLLGTTGLNSAGIGLCVNTLAQLAYSGTGLPVAFVMRCLLESRSLDQAITFLSGIDHASGQNYAIGASDRIVDFECSAGAVVQFTPHPTRVYHTNHPLVNRDLAPRPVTGSMRTPGGGAAIAVRSAPSALSNSEQRFAFLDRELGGDTTPRTVDSVKRMLSTCEVPISVSRTSAGDSMTLGSLVMELSVPPVLHVAPGPPAETAYARWTF